MILLREKNDKLYFINNKFKYAPIFFFRINKFILFYFLSNKFTILNLKLNTSQHSKILIFENLLMQFLML